MKEKRSVTLVNDDDGNSVVIINDIRFRGNSWDEWNTIEEFLKQYIGESFELLKTRERIYIGADFPNEFVGSEYTAHLWKGKKHAKANASQGIPEMIQISAPSASMYTAKEKHASDAKNGWYHYRTRFALPVIGKSCGQNLSEYKLYSAELLVRHDSNGKKYLYDLINLERYEK